MNVEEEAIQTIENASFPLYLVPPSLWRGHIFVAGAWGTTSHPLSIRLFYVDDAGAASSEKPSSRQEGEVGPMRKPPHTSKTG